MALAPEAYRDRYGRLPATPHPLSYSIWSNIMHKKKHIFHLSRGDKDPENQFHLDITLDPFEVNDSFSLKFSVIL